VVVTSVREQRFERLCVPRAWAAAAAAQVRAAGTWSFFFRSGLKSEMRRAGDSGTPPGTPRSGGSAAAGSTARSGRWRWRRRQQQKKQQQAAAAPDNAHTLQYTCQSYFRGHFFRRRGKTNMEFSSIDRFAGDP